MSVIIICLQQWDVSGLHSQTLWQFPAPTFSFPVDGLVVVTVIFPTVPSLQRHEGVRLRPRDILQTSRRHAGKVTCVTEQTTLGFPGLQQTYVLMIITCKNTNVYDYAKVELSVAELKVREFLVQMLILKYYTRIPLSQTTAKMYDHLPFCYVQLWEVQLYICKLMTTAFDFLGVDWDIGCLQSIHLSVCRYVHVLGKGVVSFFRRWTYDAFKVAC